MMPHHHAGDDLLIAYATGTLDEPVALVVATHLALCPLCRNEVVRLEELGGVLFDEQPDEALNESSFDALMARLDAPPTETATPSSCGAAAADSGDPRVPRPLRDYLGCHFEQLDWKSFGGLEEASLLPEAKGFRTRLMRIKSGTAMPAHTHKGSELTLVLAGGFSDDEGHYLRGDLAEAGPSVDHQPIADPGEDCICLAVTDAPLRLTGPLGRLLNPFLRI